MRKLNATLFKLEHGIRQAPHTLTQTKKNKNFMKVNPIGSGAFEFDIRYTYTSIIFGFACRSNNVSKQQP